MDHEYCEIMVSHPCQYPSRFCSRLHLPVRYQTNRRLYRLGIFRDHTHRTNCSRILLLLQPQTPISGRRPHQIIHRMGCLCCVGPCRLVCLVTTVLLGCDKSRHRCIQDHREIRRRQHAHIFTSIDCKHHCLCLVCSLGGFIPLHLRCRLTQA